MPIYEYACQACGHKFDTLQNFSDEPLTDCPVCGQSALKKLLSASAFHLKGSGWYVTDFKNPPAKPEAEKNKTESAHPSKEPHNESGKPGKPEPKEAASAEKSTDKIAKTDKSDEKSS